MSQVYLAFYKGIAAPRSVAWLADWVTRKVTRGIYSHCELVVELANGEYRCYSASIRDKGVRCKVMPLPAEKWDLVPISARAESVEEFFHYHRALHYDLLGAIGFVLLQRGRDDKFFCSEFCAEFLRLQESWRYHPNLLHALVSSQVKLQL
ncbi:hypothetical protein [Serratia microhaemolytica]|uniref:hypothetical protein n=1 Tax=Serratia microhaemolytica TaxID=2675110 RepID=UPI000FDDA202|nr:hypothetical protein [Serratia microhaemolytica]